jgi:hypothetical protein
VVRLKKSIPVEIYTDEAREISVAINYNPNPDRHYHEAEFDGAMFHHVEIAEVKRWLRGRIEETYNLTWQPIIKLGYDQYGSSTYWQGAELHAGLSLGATRFWLARLASGDYRQAAWGDADRGGEDRRIAGSKKISFHQLRGLDGTTLQDFATPAMFFGNGGYINAVYYYAYDEATWGRIAHIVAQTKLLNGALDALFTARHGTVPMITTGEAEGTFLLPSVAK